MSKNMLELQDELIESTIKFINKFLERNYSKSLPAANYLKSWYWKCIVTDMRFDANNKFIIKVMRPNKFIGTTNMMYELKSYLLEKYPLLNDVILEKEDPPSISKLFD